MNRFRVVFKEDPARGRWWSETTAADGSELRNAQITAARNRYNALRSSGHAIIKDLEKYASEDYAVDPVLVEAVHDWMNRDHGNNPPAHLVDLFNLMKENSEANW